MQNIFSGFQATPTHEAVEELLRSPHVRIERIVSNGQASPEGFWYDQDESEWVAVLEGRAAIGFENGEAVELSAGDAITIPAHTRHRVLWTHSEQRTVWLAVFYQS
ncbi:cupin domain-containing protein [Chlorobium phaeovibrioides]|nr:cupin domain-containing protein [Chlorobium phaeovibrioides]QEQ57277.1 cupin domain-containing protein [Chlorobium phaeovibrioides]